MPPDEGRDLAEEQGLDLVEVAPDADPPVCRIMDYGKFKYQQSKKKQSKSDNVSLKTLRFRPKTQEHDLQTKLDRAKGFIEKGNQVQFEMQMRGRERKFEDRWVEKLEDIIESLDEQLERDITIVNPPTAEGWNIRAIIEPS
jgi:translation initiation factor IF-3